MLCTLGCRVAGGKEKCAELYLGLGLGPSPRCRLWVRPAQPVTSCNAESLRAAVVNGPSLHPGARFVEDERGRLVDLAKVSPPVRRYS